MFKVEFRFRSGRAVYRNLEQEDLDMIFSSDKWEDVLQQYDFATHDALPLIFRPNDIEYIEAMVTDE